MAKSKYLYRDIDNAKISGVCAGLSDYFDLDITLVRVLWVVLTFFGVGSLLIVYLILSLVVEPKNVVLARVKKEKLENDDSDDPFAKFD